MQYLINLSEESDHFLRQLCDLGRRPHSEAVSVEDFLSAFVEEQLDDLFVRRERSKTASATERAKAWSEAVIATHAALEAMRKLVAAAATDQKVDRIIGERDDLGQRERGNRTGTAPASGVGTSS
jgi:hypothetical protein